jgi:transcriptional regulator with XRE-family HTH domain
MWTMRITSLTATGQTDGRVAVRTLPGAREPMARKKQPPISDADREVVGGLLRDLRRAAGYRSVERAAGTRGCPASRQTIYTYERGEATPTLAQFLELVRFYVLDAPAGGADADNLLGVRGVAAVTRALDLRMYHVVQARELMGEMQPDLGATS